MATFRAKVVVRTTAITIVVAAASPTASLADDSGAVAIQRCEAASGEVVYTDRSCASANARSTPIPPELVSRITYDTAQTGTVVSLGMYRDDTTRGPIPKRRSLVEGCARSPRQLSLDLQGSLAQHDVNRLAESFHWVGMTHRQSRQVMDRLSRLTDQPLQGAQYFNAQIGPADETSPSESAGMLQLLLAGGNGASIVDLDVHRYSGCYFVSFQPDVTIARITP
ncbi:hypothetical protein [Lysobacter niastensis]|uniref:DUF4124 domain-containing protein n=1 Tax=Lysobacter niastensis TaxID=380629 RepID=A0ABS0B207_9GAMM|nr:hypothetical protein [Lysobacter niastensis]MBF6022507.1 hypothetical protein [Lysobacter niastensis]